MTVVGWRELLVRVDDLPGTMFTMTILRRIDDPEWATADRGLMRILAVLGRLDAIIAIDDEPVYLCIGLRPASMHDH